MSPSPQTQQAPIVFISYAHESDALRVSVKELADWLGAHGCTVLTDHAFGYRPPEKGWQAWMLDCIVKANIVLVVCTPRLKARYEKTESPNTGFGGTYEGAIVTQHIYDAQMRNTKFYPVLPDQGSLEDVPTTLKPWWNSHRFPSGYEGIRCMIFDEPPGAKSTLTTLGPHERVTIEKLDAADAQSSQQPGKQPVDPSTSSTPSSSKPSTSPSRQEERQRLSTELETAYGQCDELLSTGQDTRAIDAQILELKRRLREGHQLQPGEFLCEGRFKLLEPLGRGGFATIWKSMDRRRHELVALKVLHGQHADDRSRRERFFRGARHMRALQHQHIVQVLEEELTDDGYYFFVMEYLAGGDFRQAVLNDHIPIKERLAVVEAVGAALQFAHERDVIHRDVKPANIVMDAQYRPKLTDFDLVRAMDTTGGTRTGALGTVIYAAPECLNRPQDADVPADVYGLGMTAVFALYGLDLPFDVIRHGDRFFDKLAIDQSVKAVLQKAIAWNPAERYQSVTEFCMALRDAGNALVSVTTPPDVPQQPQAFSDDLTDGSKGPAMIWLPGDTFTMWDEMSPEESEKPAHRFTLAPPEATPELPTEPVPGLRDPLADGSPGPAMVWLPGGVFTMGDDNSPYNNWEKPAHPVTVDAFSIGQYPVTHEEFDRFCQMMGRARRDDRGWDNGTRPVTGVSWDEATAYCDWLSQQSKARYRLLSEAEWEYACRAGSNSPYCFGDDEERLGEYAWYSQNAEGKPHPVGKKLPNNWHLYDLHGNVWEWVQDRFGDYPKQSQHNPSGPEIGSNRVFRGGSWVDDAGYCRSAYRGLADPGHRNNNLGFRLAREGAWLCYPFTLIRA